MMLDIKNFRNAEIRDGPCPSSRFTAVVNPNPPASTPVPVNQTVRKDVGYMTDYSG